MSRRLLPIQAETYSAQKAWGKVFSEGLAEELRGSGVTANAVMPGMGNTGFHDRAAVDIAQITPVSWITAK